jgi:hypothetical protein
VESLPDKPRICELFPEKFFMDGDFRTDVLPLPGDRGPLCRNKLPAAT